MKALIARLQAANAAYRNHQPVMTDAAYDLLEDELRKLVAANPTDPAAKEATAFLAGIGAPATNSAWKKIKHDAPMGSLNKAQTVAELKAWHQSCSHLSARLVVSEKLDGISCFSGETPIHLANGETVPISEVVGKNLRPVVRTWSPETGETMKRVVATYDNGLRENWVRLTLEDESTLVVTEDHLFYTQDGRWLSAKDLLGEDLLTTE